MKFIHPLNIPHWVCHATIGREHKPHHRMIAGIVVMSIGVSIAKASSYFDAHFMHYLLDGVGYGIHGIGLTPFIESWLE